MNIIGILLTVLLVIVIAGGLLYVLSILPIDTTIKSVGRVIIILLFAVFAILWLMDFLGVVAVGHHYIGR